MMYKYTIVIPMYNSEKTIEECLNSIINQYMNEFRVLICDDGSTDESISIVKKIRGKFDYIKLVELKHCGVSEARNHGIKLVDTEALVFVDSDDTLKKGALKVISENYNGEDIMNISPMTDLNLVKNEIDQKDIIKSISYIDTDVLKAGEYLAAPFNKVFNTKFLQDNRINFNQELFIGEDMLFNIIAVTKTKNIKFIKGSIYNYQFNPTSITRSFDERTLSNEQIFNKLIKEYFLELNMLKELNFVYEKLTLGGILAVLNSYVIPQDKSLKQKKMILSEFCKNEAYSEVLSKFKNYSNCFNYVNLIYLSLLNKKMYKTTLIASTFIEPLIRSRTIIKNKIKGN